MAENARAAFVDFAGTTGASPEEIQDGIDALSTSPVLAKFVARILRQSEMWRQDLFGVEAMLEDNTLTRDREECEIPPSISTSRPEAPLTS